VPGPVAQFYAPLLRAMNSVSLNELVALLAEELTSEVCSDNGARTAWILHLLSGESMKCFPPMITLAHKVPVEGWVFTTRRVILNSGVMLQQFIYPLHPRFCFAFRL